MTEIEITIFQMFRELGITQKDLPEVIRILQKLQPIMED